MILECEDSETGRGSWRRIGRKWRKTSQSCRPVAALSLRNRMPAKEHRASDYLKTPGDIAAYLNAATEEFDGDPRLLMRVFRSRQLRWGWVVSFLRSCPFAIRGRTHASGEVAQESMRRADQARIRTCNPMPQRSGPSLRRGGICGNPPPTLTPGA